MVKIRVEHKREWLKIYWDLWKAGLLKDVSVNDINLPESAFPLEIPIELDGLIDLLGNPLVRPYKKKIDTTLKENLAKVIG